MAEFNDRRSGRGRRELAYDRRALEDAYLDSMGTYGRTHEASKVMGTELGERGDAIHVAMHHTSEVNNPRCAACKSDVKQGIHPLA
jgi:hypothetical protein